MLQTLGSGSLTLEPPTGASYHLLCVSPARQERLGAGLLLPTLRVACAAKRSLALTSAERYERRRPDRGRWGRLGLGAIGVGVRAGQSGWLRGYGRTWREKERRGWPLLGLQVARL